VIVSFCLVRKKAQQTIQSTSITKMRKKIKIFLPFSQFSLSLFCYFSLSPVNLFSLTYKEEEKISIPPPVLFSKKKKYSQKTTITTNIKRS
jgi:hypothetical protein